MEYILTLVAAKEKSPLLDAHLVEVGRCLSAQVLGIRWLSLNKAADLQLSATVKVEELLRVETVLAKDKIDFFIVADDGRRRKKLLVADMDNTMVIGETLDELANQFGLRKIVAATTKRAMQGDLDFQDALRTRVSVLKGLAEKALETTLAGIQPMAGGELLVRTMRRNGARCILVSGGFTCFTEPIAARLGFLSHHGNRLEIKDGQLTGKVHEPILDHQVKLLLLQRYATSYGLDLAETLAVGDGANDLAMVSAAGLGVGYHPGPFLKKRVVNNIVYGDLTALLYAQGYADF